MIPLSPVDRSEVVKLIRGARRSHPAAVFIDAPLRVLPTVLSSCGPSRELNDTERVLRKLREKNVTLAELDVSRVSELSQLETNTAPKGPKRAKKTIIAHHLLSEFLSRT